MMTKQERKRERTLIVQITTRLLAGEDAQVIADDLGLQTADDSRCARYTYDGVAILLPGAVADDGNAEVEYPEADTLREAAQSYVDDGDRGDPDDDEPSTSWVDVWAWRVGLVLVPVEGDEDKRDVDTVEIDRERYTIKTDPDEPECADGCEHDWRSPLSVVGGIAENPGVWGHGGGVVMTEVCRHCGCYRVTDTWAQRMDTGEQGLRSTKYREADDESLAWVARKDAEMLDESSPYSLTARDGRISTAIEVIRNANGDEDEDAMTRELETLRAALPAGWTADWTGSYSGDEADVEIIRG